MSAFIDREIMKTHYARLEGGEWIKIAADSIDTALANGYEIRTEPAASRAQPERKLTDDVRMFLTDCANTSGLMVNGNKLSILAKRVLRAQPAAATVPDVAALPFAILPDEMAALQRFHDCVTDGEGYDVPKEMMRRLSEIGLVRRVTAAFYEHTTFGLSVLNGDFTSTPAAQAQDDGETR